MLDNFLEHNIQKKLRIFFILQSRNSLSMKELSDMTHISPTSIHTLIEELNFDLQGICKIHKEAHSYVIDICEGVSSFEIYHAIYQNSNVLHCLEFMINNTNHVSISEFSEEYFLTRPSAYRIRHNCIRYLKEIGLDVEKNKVVGKEYRIRFLIALLYYKFGIDCCGIDAESIHLARELILATNNAIDMPLLESTESEYGYFECLLILSWKRQNHPLAFQSEELETLKSVFVYPILRAALQNILEDKLQLSFSENDFNYVFLAYCCTNNCVLADKWTTKDIEHVHKIVFSNPKMNSLLECFEKNGFGEICHTPAFRSMIVYFSKKCLFDLHCIIPDRHFYLEIYENPWKTLILKVLSKTLQEWKELNHIPYPIADGHLQYLTIQIASIAQQFVRPVQVIILSDLPVELEVLKLYLTRTFSHRRIYIRQILFSAEDFSDLSSQENSVIIAKKVLAPALKSLNFASSTHLVPINIEISETDRQSIAQAISSCEEKEIERLI